MNVSKYLLLLIGLVTMVGFIVFNPAKTPNLSSAPIDNTPTPTYTLDKAPDLRQIKYNDQSYVFDYWKTGTKEQLVLIANFTERKSFEQLKNENGCLFGINGGFYSEEFTPLGLVVIDGVTYSKYRENKLFNGIVAIGVNSFYVGDYIENQFQYAVQTGPVLIRGGQPVELALIRDKSARRMVSGLNSDGELYMFFIGSSYASTDGPLLDELPRLMKEISDQEKLDLQAVVNLDGGSASGYLNDGVQIKNWQPIGSWWCVKS